MSLCVQLRKAFTTEVITRVPGYFFPISTGAEQQEDDNFEHKNILTALLKLSGAKICRIASKMFGQRNGMEGISRPMLRNLFVHQIFVYAPPKHHSKHVEETQAMMVSQEVNMIL